MIKKFFQRLMCDHTYHEVLRRRVDYLGDPCHVEAYKCAKCGKVYATLEKVK